MRKDAECSVANCHTRKETKPRRYAPYGALPPLLIPDHLWQNTPIDFVVGPDGYDPTWVAVDWLPKQQHIVPCTLY